MATEVTLDAKIRTEDEVGTSPSRRMRRAGLVPATLYGRGEPRNVSVPARELRKALTTDAGLNVLLTLDFGDGDRELTLAREISRNPIRDEYTHLDFIRVSRTEKVAADVPIVFIGSARGVHEDGGMLDQSEHTIEVKAFPSDIPSSVEIDITALGLGQHITVADIALPVGVDIVSDADAVIVAVVAASGAEPVAGEGEEGAEASTSSEG